MEEKINHPFLVTYYRTFNIVNSLFKIYEYVEG